MIDRDKNTLTVGEAVFNLHPTVLDIIEGTAEERDQAMLMLARVVLSSTPDNWMDNIHEARLFLRKNL
jgi:hypothetical protein